MINWSKLLLILTLATLPTVGFSQRIADLKPKNGTEVGNIPFDSSLDNPDFKLCGGAIPQYYAVSGGYRGGRKQLLKLLRAAPIIQQMSSSVSSGYITVRFVVNCKGETDRFRVLQVDQDYQPTEFGLTLVDTMLAFTKGLTDWLPVEYQGATYDYFQYLTFKIADGKVVDLLP